MAGGAAWVVLFSITVSGCAGSTPVDPKVSPKTATAPRSTSTATTAAGKAAARAADVALAAKGVLVKGDLSADWKQFRAGTGVIKITRQGKQPGCAVAAGQLPPWTVAYDGGMYRKRKLSRYLEVAAAAFKDDAAAKSYVAKLRSPGYVACATKAKAAEIAKDRKAAPGSTWRAGPVEKGSGPLEAKLHYIYQARVNGKVIDANGREDLAVYRRGRLLIIFSYRSSTSNGEPRNIARSTDRDLRNAASRVLKRVPG